MDNTVFPSPHLILRQRLVEPLGQLRRARLVLVTAPAGYGKTTLLAQWAAGLAQPCVWLALDETFNSPVRFLAALVAALREQGVTLPAPEGESPAALSYTLGRAFQGGAAGWVWVLDDYHTLANPEIHRALDALLMLPSWPVRLVIASRTQPPLLSAARLRVEGRLVELDENDLRMDAGEARQMLLNQGVVVDERQLEQVLQRTEGWPAALNLFGQAVQRRSGGMDAALNSLAHEQHVFDYLAAEVLQHQPPEVRRFLLGSSVLPFLEVGLCDACLGIHTSGSILERIERSHLFLARQGGETGPVYRYHALFSQFLVRCLEQERGPDGLCAARLHAAACLLPPEDPAPRLENLTAAIDLLLAAQAWDQAAAAINAAARRLDWGQVIAMHAWFERLPPTALAGHPHLRTALGLLRERQCRWDEARQILEQADQDFLSAGPGENEGRVRLLLLLARIEMRQASYATASGRIHQALEILAGEARLAGRLAAEQAEAYRLLGGCYAEQGDCAQGERYLRLALAGFRRLGNRISEGRVLSNIAGTIFLNQGRLLETIEMEEQAVRLLDEAGSYQVSFVLSRLGEAYTARGQYPTAQAVLERLLRLTDLHQDRMMRGYALYELGHLQREQGRSQLAEASYRESLALGEELREPALSFEPRHGLVLLALERGDWVEARRQARAALASARQSGMRVYEGQGLAALGRVCLYTPGAQSLQPARQYFDAARAIFEQIEAFLDLATAYLFLAEVHRRAAQLPQALACLEQVLVLSSRYDYEFLIIHRLGDIGLPLLALALVFGSGEQSEAAQRLLLAAGSAAAPALLESLVRPNCPPDGLERVVRLLAELGDEQAAPALQPLLDHPALKPVVQAALERIAARPLPLAIRALGGFQVRRGRQVLSDEAFSQRRKARLLLVYLLAQAPRQVPRDELLERFWPDLAPDSAALALNTTFSELRKLLEPNLLKGRPSRYVLREGDCFRFQRDSLVDYDVWNFEAALGANPLQAARVLELYRGDFLPEEPYDDWSMSERERLRSLYTNALLTLLEQRLAEGAWREGAALAGRILERDAWLEEVWHALIRCNLRLGRPSEARQAYQSCERSLRRELDVAPSAETRALLAELD